MDGWTVLNLNIPYYGSDAEVMRKKTDKIRSKEKGDEYWQSGCLNLKI